jgi:hypothetical protein
MKKKNISRSSWGFEKEKKYQVRKYEELVSTKRYIKLKSKKRAPNWVQKNIR